MKLLYQKALSYAYFIDPKLYKDIVHDSFIRWFEKTGKDLFDEHERTVMSVIKKTWWSYYVQPHQYMRQGMVLMREYVSFDDGFCFNHVTPEDEFIAKELEERFLHCGNMTQLTIYKYAVMGWTQKQIASIMNESPQFINYYFKKMRYMAAILN